MSPSLARPVRRRSLCPSFVALAGLVAVVALSVSRPPSVARAGDPPAPAVPAASPRQAALEAVIHRLERHLAFLRKARTELESGRTEPVPADDLARHRMDVDRRGVREVSRYESARLKVAAALVEAESSKDVAKASDAKAALDALDSRFVDTMKKLEASLDAPPNATPKAAAGDATPTKSATGTPSKGGTTPKAGTPPKKASKPTGDSSMSGGSSSEGSSQDDEDADETTGEDSIDDEDGDDGDDDAAAGDVAE